MKQVSEVVWEIFNQQRGFAKTKDIVNQGITSYYIRKLEAEGEIIRIKQGLYRHAKYETEQYNEWIEISKIIPNGVICLLSAMSFYELTTYNPWEYQVAIFRGAKKPSLPEYPPIKIMYFSDNRFHLGVDEVVMDGSRIQIYDREKTICDMIFYREKVGIDLMKEGLRNYLKQPSKNITKLMKYAKDLRINTILQKYLEVLL
jgi:predicted transcriptional regulator of viral defense system